MDVKENLAQNLILYRKSKNLTQLELAEILNYTDKAVSKWERGESVPDLAVLHQLAQFYGVTIDALVQPPKPVSQFKPLNLPKKRFLICLLSTGLVWLIATLCFAFLGIIIPSLEQTWLAFIYAIPITCIIMLVLMSVWGKSISNAVVTSLLVWSTITAVFLTLLNTLLTPVNNLWMIYLIGIPLQILIILWFSYRKIK